MVNTKSTLRDIAYIAIAAALLITLQVALAVVPNVELVSLFVILYSIFLGRRTLAAIYVFALVEGLIYGFHTWWITYLYVWTILFFIARAFKNERNPLAWAVISGLFGICFGFLTSFPYLFMLGPGGWTAYIISGIPFDLLHCAGNFLTALLLFKPLSLAFGKLPGVEPGAAIANP